MNLRVRVPATSANLGPGFDCLGLALELWNETEFSTETSNNSISIHGEGRERLPTDERNTILKTARLLAERAGRLLPPLKLDCHNNIPLSSGLGSSSAALLTGLLGGNALLGNPYSQSEILTLAAELEGHPDNVSPALLGGLVISALQDGQVLYRRIEPPPLHITIVLPGFHLATKKARAALPKNIPHADAVFNTSRALLVVEAFRSGDLQLLGRVMEDRLHQPYRIPLIPGARDALEVMRLAGAEAAALSGAGPSLVAFSSKREDAIGESARRAFEQVGLTARIFRPEISLAGAQVIRQ